MKVLSNIKHLLTWQQLNLKASQSLVMQQLIQNMVFDKVIPYRTSVSLKALKCMNLSGKNLNK